MNTPQARNNAMQKVSVFYKWLAAEGLVDVNPCKDFLYAIEPKDLPALAPTTTEIRRLLHAIQPETRNPF